jgi:hypothetical protein
VRGDSTVVVAEVDGAVDKGSGGSVFADAISFSSIFAAPGPLPTAGTEPICFVAGAVTNEDETASDGEVVVANAGAVVAKGSGGSVFADAISFSSIFAAEAPLPTAGTDPIWPLVGAFSRGDASARNDEVFVENAGAVLDKGFGGSVFADAISSSSIFAAPGPLPTAGTDPICFPVGAGMDCGEGKEGESVSG